MPMRYFPSHTSNPVGTLVRVLKSGDPAARAAVWRTLLGVAAAPVDLLLSTVEKSSYRRSSEPRLPIVFVCGPARSGTSVTAQFLIRHFPVAYFSNVVELFPRAPLTASRLLTRSDSKPALELSSFYGKTRGLREPSDAMALWDRWFGADRDSVPKQLSAETLMSLRRFFAAWESSWRRPIVAKYNRLYLCADLIAPALPNAHFVCLERDPLYLAQSQLAARRLIVGDENRPYGTVTPEYQQLRRPGRPLEDACAYVAADRQVVARTRDHVGPERFWIVSYERFCEEPQTLLERLSTEVLGLPFDPVSDSERAAIRVSRSKSLDDETFAVLERTCGELGLFRGRAEYFA
jgi:hypothetical protein